MTAIEFLPRKIVEKKLAKRGSKITTVVFAKKSGDIVRRTGMPKVHKRRVGGAAGPAATPESIKRAATASKSLKDHGNIFFDSPDPEKRGFAFNLDRVIHI